MKNECSIIRDLLPLYFENMVSEDTAAFIKEHLAACPACAAELEAMGTRRRIDEAAAAQRETDASAINGLKKKLRKRKWIAASIIAACLLAVALLLHCFPFYRVAETGTSFYSTAELAKLIFIGSGADRAQAQAILRQADAAFHDCTHTHAENEALYGLLARYATAADRYPSAVFTTYSLELWSAHLGPKEGYLWVYYSCEAYDDQGNAVHGSRNVPSLWKVEKDGTGAWVVVNIKEHP